MADSPTVNTDGPLGVTIKLNGTDLSDEVGIVSVHVEKELNRIPTATVVLDDGSIATNEFPVTDGDDAKPGTEIEIAAFWGSNSAQTLFKGIITATRLRVRADTGAQLELTCRDKAIALTEIRKTATSTQSTDSDVMSAIIQDAGLTADVATTNGPQTDIVQYDSADWDFLRILADRNGLALAVDDGKITAAAPDPTVSAALTLRLGMDVIEFDAKIDTVQLEKTVSLTGWSPADQQVTTQTSDASDGGSWGNSTYSDLTGVTGDRTRAVTVPYADGQVSLSDVAAARAARAALGAMQGRCIYVGSAAAGPGDTIELTGVGDRMGGTAFLSGIVHELKDGRWTTTALMGLPRGWRGDSFAAAGPAAGALTAPVHGLHVATVLAIVDDGTNALSDTTMVKISLPLMGETPAEIWARYAQPYASNSVGIQFLPEIGDEVIVGFLSADPSSPVILGSLHSGKLPRKNEATDANELKTLTTISGVAITFDDDKKILTAETPGGHTLVMDDDQKTVTITDLTGNSIEMSSSGVKIDSTGTLDLTASSDITVSSSGGDVSISGNNVTANGNMGATVSGGSSAELSAGGQTTVKGAMVMIN